MFVEYDKYYNHAVSQVLYSFSLFSLCEKNLLKHCLSVLQTNYLLQIKYPSSISHIINISNESIRAIQVRM